MHENLDDKIRTLAEWIKESSNIVFFGGAGVSSESGIKTFRGADGLYNEKVWTNDHITTEICHLVQTFLVKRSRAFKRGIQSLSLCCYPSRSVSPR